MTLATKHEPYSIDLLTYEIASSFVNQSLPFNRFSGRRVRQSSAKLEGIKKRERRLRKMNLSVVNFAS